MSGAALLADLVALGGAGAEVTELSDSVGAPRRAPGLVRIGVSRAGPLPKTDLEAFDILLCSDPAAPAPWVGRPLDQLDATVETLRGAIERQPVAAAVAAQVLRATLQLEFDQALVMESLAYSMLLASDAFRAWRVDNPPRARPDDRGERVRVETEGEAIAIRLDRPAARNAVDAAMRDALTEALTFALDHPDRPPVILSGQGAAFSAGGDLDEFGSAQDVGRAHLIRTLRSPASLAHALGRRLTARLHGACVGAGIEMPAAAGRVVVTPGAFFRLPEVSMGLIPGAGGTASIPRRIGRARACFMALSGLDVDLDTALAWGLVDERVQA